jgi:hypothetical protein
MNCQEPTYELEVSRIFGAPPSAVRRAFTDPELRAQWFPTDGRPMPDLSESAEDASLTWAEQGSSGEVPLGSASMVRVELRDEPGGRALLKLKAGPYNEARETDARAWWNSAFSHLDTMLDSNGR